MPTNCVGARVHDRTELELSELEGYAEMGDLRRVHPVGGPEYRALREEAEKDGCVGRHFQCRTARRR